MTVIITILFWMTGARAAIDARYRCEHLLFHNQSVQRWLVDQNYLSEVEAEHSSVGYASLVERTSRTSRMIPRALHHYSRGRSVIAVVKPSGEALVIEASQNRFSTLSSERTDEVRVAAFGRDLKSDGRGGWIWRDQNIWRTFRFPAPGPIEIGDTPKSWLLDYYRDVMTKLVRLNQLSVESLRTARAFRGMYQLKPLHVLIYDDPEDGDETILVLDEADRDTFARAPDLSNGESIVLNDGRRIGLKGEGWVILPPPHWMDDPEVLAYDEELEQFKTTYPHALDQLLIHPETPADLDFATARMQAVRDEETDQSFELLILDLAEPSKKERVYFLYDPEHARWVDEADLVGRTFVNSHGQRYGHGLRAHCPKRKTQWQRLPEAGEFERARKLFDIEAS